MPQPTKGARMGGSPAHQRLILSNLASALFEHKAIQTTEARARRLRPFAEKLISKAKRGDLHSRRQVMKVISRKDIIAELFEELAPKFEGRDGGYTRITKLPNRKGDNAPMALIELVLEPVKAKKKAAPKKEAPKKDEPKAAEPVEAEDTVEVELDDVAEDAEVAEDAAVEAEEAAEDAADEAAEEAEEVAEEAAEEADDAAEDAADEK